MRRIESLRAKLFAEPPCWGNNWFLLSIARRTGKCYRSLLFMRISGSRIALALLMAVPVFGQAPLPPLPSELPVLAPVTNSRVRRVLPIARPGRDISPRQFPTTLSSNGLPPPRSAISQSMSPTTFSSGTQQKRKFTPRKGNSTSTSRSL